MRPLPAPGLENWAGFPAAGCRRCPGCGGEHRAGATEGPREGPFLALLTAGLGAFLPLALGFAAGFALAGLVRIGEAGRALAGVLGLLAAGTLVCLIRKVRDRGSPQPEAPRGVS
jgi:hypothetical protein